MQDDASLLVCAVRDLDFDQAEALMYENKAEYDAGHRDQAELVAKMVAGEQVVVDLLLAHAEDQLMATDSWQPNSSSSSRMRSSSSTGSSNASRLPK